MNRPELLELGNSRAEEKAGPVILVFIEFGHSPMHSLSNTVFFVLSRRTHLRLLVDRVGAALVLLLAGPLLLFIACLVRLGSPGPALVRKRYYLGTRQALWLWTFRTSVQRRGHKGVTRIGSALEKTGLNHLPKVIDVFTGRLALFGVQPAPRPQVWRNANPKAFGPGLICAKALSLGQRS